MALQRRHEERGPTVIRPRFVDIGTLLDQEPGPVVVSLMAARACSRRRNVKGPETVEDPGEPRKRFEKAHVVADDGSVRESTLEAEGSSASEVVKFPQGPISRLFCIEGRNAASEFQERDGERLFEGVGTEMPVARGG